MYAMEDRTYSRLVISIALGTILIFPIILVGFVRHARSPPDQVAVEPPRDGGKKEGNFTVKISRQHVGMWFDFPVLYVNSSVYNKSELEGLVKLTSWRFSTIVIDPPPVVGTYHDGSHMYVPVLAAERNHEMSAKHYFKKLTVVVSFTDGTMITKAGTVTSFELAKIMGDMANGKFNGTVTTLLYVPHPTWIRGRSFARENLTQSMGISRRRLNTNTEWIVKGNHPYKLGVLIGLDDCLNQHSILHQDVMEALPSIDILFISFRFGFFHSSWTNLTLDGDIAGNLDRMQLANLRKCENVVWGRKAKVEIVPSVTCSKSSEGGNYHSKQEGAYNLISCWKLMNNWAKEQDRRVVMHSSWELWMSETRPTTFNHTRRHYWRGRRNRTTTSTTPEPTPLNLN